MRNLGKAVVLTAAALSMALAGCSGTNSNGGTSSSPSTGGTTGTTGSSASASATATAGAAGGGNSASCVVGNWKSTGLSGQLANGGVNGTIQGGGGFTLTIAGDGGTVVAFDGMQPITFTFAIGGNDVKGSFVYGGKVTGTLKLPATGATSGNWEPTGTSDFNTLTVTVDLTAPVQVRLANKLPIKDFVGTGTAQTGNAVDAQPILKNGTYKCAGNTLELGPPAGTPVPTTWTLQRV